MRRRGGCRTCGCYIPGCLVLVLLLLVGWVLAVQAGLPQKAGLLKPPTQRLLSLTPDREAGAALQAELQRGGFPINGVTITVYPGKGNNPNLAVAVLDAREGFSFGSGGDDAILDTLKRLATGDTATKYGIGRVAMHYIDAEGRDLISLTASTDATRSFANGQLSRDGFLKAIDGKVDLPGLTQGVLAR